MLSDDTFALLPTDFSSVDFPSIIATLEFTDGNNYIFMLQTGFPLGTRNLTFVLSRISEPLFPTSSYSIGPFTCLVMIGEPSMTFGNFMSMVFTLSTVGYSINTESLLNKFYTCTVSEPGYGCQIRFEANTVFSNYFPMEIWMTDATHPLTDTITATLKYIHFPASSYVFTPIKNLFKRQRNIFYIQVSKASTPFANAVFIGNSPMSGFNRAVGLLLENSVDQSTVITFNQVDYYNNGTDILSYDLSSSSQDRLVHTSTLSVSVNASKCSIPYGEMFEDTNILPGMDLLEARTEISNVLTRVGSTYAFPLVNSYKAPYPFAYRQRFSNGSIEYSATLLLPKVTNSITVGVCQSVSWTMNTAYQVEYPTIISIGYIPITSYSYIVMLKASHTYGITLVVYNDLYTIDSSYLVEGSATNGTWAFEVTSFDLSLLPKLYPRIDIISFTASKSATPNTVINKNFELAPYIPQQALFTDIIYFQFLNNNINLSSSLYTDVENSLFLNIVALDPTKLPVLVIGEFIDEADTLSKYSFPAVYDTDRQMYRFDFLIPVETLIGEMAYSILSFGSVLQYKNIYSYLLANATLNIVSSATKMVAFPSVNFGIAPQQTMNLGWDVTIVDKIGFKYGVAQVVSDLDNEPFIVNINASVRVSGDQFNGVYRISIPVNGNCITQSYYISSLELQDQREVKLSFIYDGVNTLYGGDNDAQRFIKLVCSDFSYLVDHNKMDVTSMLCASSSKLTKSQLIGIIVGCSAVGIAVIIGATLFIHRQRRFAKQRKNMQSRLKAMQQ
eukprot:gene12348-14480_t